MEQKEPKNMLLLMSKAFQRMAWVVGENNKQMRFLHIYTIDLEKRIKRLEQRIKTLEDRHVQES